MIALDLTHFFLFLAVTGLLTKDSEVCYKASSILQLFKLSILTSQSNYNDYYSLDPFLLVLRCYGITDRGIGGLSSGLKHLASLHTINLNFGG